jgi:hypothetical protein
MPPTARATAGQEALLAELLAVDAARAWAEAMGALEAVV